jgi:hypothetical protein
MIYNDRLVRYALLLALPLLSGCVAYPKVYWRTLKGTARVEDGKPVTIKGGIVKTCETLDGEVETPKKERETVTDAKGGYRLPVRGLVWHSRGFISHKECSSRVQLYVCRPHCKPVDQVDIDVLGK